MRRFRRVWGQIGSPDLGIGTPDFGFPRARVCARSLLYSVMGGGERRARVGGSGLWNLRRIKRAFFCLKAGADYVIIIL